MRCRVGATLVQPWKGIIRKAKPIPIPESLAPRCFLDIASCLHRPSNEVSRLKTCERIYSLCLALETERNNSRNSPTQLES